MQLALSVSPRVQRLHVGLNNRAQASTCRACCFLFLLLYGVLRIYSNIQKFNSPPQYSSKFPLASTTCNFLLRWRQRLAGMRSTEILFFRQFYTQGARAPRQIARQPSPTDMCANRTMIGLKPVVSLLQSWFQNLLRQQ